MLLKDLPQEARPREKLLSRGAAALSDAELLALLLRSLVLVATAAGLQVDEAQYWDWSRHLQWGYWSKPPGIAAVIAYALPLRLNIVVAIAAAVILCLCLERIKPRIHGTPA